MWTSSKTLDPQLPSDDWSEISILFPGNGSYMYGCTIDNLSHIGTSSHSISSSKNMLIASWAQRKWTVEAISLSVTRDTNIICHFLRHREATSCGEKGEISNGGFDGVLPCCSWTKFKRLKHIIIKIYNFLFYLICFSGCL